jgi:HK97 family phage prohead protease
MHKKSGQSPGLETKRLQFAECKLAVSENAADVMEFSGYGAVFGNVDSYGDVIQKGAFSSYLSDVHSGKQNWPALLMQHGGFGFSADDITPVGVYSDLKEDDFGLKTVGKLAPTPRGTEAYTLMKMQPRPAISGLSIGYYVVDEEKGGKNDPYRRLIKQIDLVEISIVTFPANDQARVGSVKSAQDYNDREFERLMLGAGFSRKEALIIMNQGFRHLKTKLGAGDEMLDEIADMIRKNTQHIKL